jgi:hypothetical protein
MAFWFVFVHEKKNIQREENQNKKYNKLFSEQRRDVEQTVSGRYTLSKLILYFLLLLLSLPSASSIVAFYHEKILNISKPNCSPDRRDRS